jgi:hypothetical protein
VVGLEFFFWRRKKSARDFVFSKDAIYGLTRFLASHILPRLQQQLVHLAVSTKVLEIWRQEIHLVSRIQAVKATSNAITNHGYVTFFNALLWIDTYRADYGYGGGGNQYSTTSYGAQGGADGGGFLAGGGSQTSPSGGKVIQTEGILLKMSAKPPCSQEQTTHFDRLQSSSSLTRSTMATARSLRLTTRPSRKYDPPEKY